MTGASHPDLSYPLYEFLKSLVPLQAFAVLIIDEAQNLSPALLEEIRILSDLESPEKLLQVVLVGQLELRAKLKLPEMRQLDQRVSARCTLEPLNREGVAGYISHRLSVAGGADDRVHFSPNAIDAVFRVSGRRPACRQSRVRPRAAPRPPRSGRVAIDLEAVTQAIDDLGVGSLTAAPASLTAPITAPAAPPSIVVQPAPSSDGHGADDVGPHSGDGTCHCVDRKRHSGDGARRSEQRTGRSDATPQGRCLQTSLRPRGAQHRGVDRGAADVRHAGVLTGPRCSGRTGRADAGAGA